MDSPFPDAPFYEELGVRPPEEYLKWIYADHGQLLARTFSEAAGRLAADQDDPLADDMLLAGALPKQIEFIKNDAAHAIYSGAWRAGKSYALCVKLVRRARVPGAREGLCRKWNSVLTRTTLRTLLDGSGETPPVLPPGTYRHFKSRQVISIHGGGEITYFGLDDPDKLGSLDLTGVAIDEVVDINERDYQMLSGRCSVVVQGLPRQRYSACNPGAPSHFIAKRFALAESSPEPAWEGYFSVRTRSRDNTYLPEDYLADLDKMPGVAGLRYREGRWVGSEGLVYPTWDESKHSHPREMERRYVIGVDDGVVNPFALGRCGINFDGHIHVEAELKRSGMSYPQKVDAVFEMMPQHLADDGDTRLVWPEAVIVDPSAKGLIGELANAGFNVVGANNARDDGIQKVTKRLVTGRLSVEPTCAETKAEFASYERLRNKQTGEFKEEPKKENDHIMDLVRYVVMYVDAHTAVSEELEAV